jgi:hypothetical protein
MCLSGCTHDYLANKYLRKHIYIKNDNNPEQFLHLFVMRHANLAEVFYYCCFLERLQKHLKIVNNIYKSPGFTISDYFRTLEIIYLYLKCTPQMSFCISLSYKGIKLGA